MKISVRIDIPPGETCNYPPKGEDARGYACAWRLHHTAARKNWCRIFGDVDVTSGYKCDECLQAARAEAALSAEGVE